MPFTDTTTKPHTLPTPRVRWHRPRCQYPQMEIIVSNWNSYVLQQWRLLAKRRRSTSGLSPSQIVSYRNSFAKVANRSGYYAGLHYLTTVHEGELYICILSHVPGLPKPGQEHLLNLQTLCHTEDLKAWPEIKTRW